MSFRVLRLYCSRRGIWRYEFERDGKVYWSSLHTRSESNARARYEWLARITKVPSEAVK